MKKVRDPWGASSINPMLARLRAIFADLQAQGAVVRNPAALVKALPSTRPTLTTLDAGQIATLLTATAAGPLHAAWRLPRAARCHYLYSSTSKASKLSIRTLERSFVSVFVPYY